MIKTGKGGDLAIYKTKGSYRGQEQSSEIKLFVENLAEGPFSTVFAS